MQLLSYTNKTLLSSTMSLHGAQILVFQDAIRKHEYKIWVCAAPKLHLNMCSRGKSGKYPYYISTIEMGSLWQGKTYLYNASSLLGRDWVNRRGLDLWLEIWKKSCGAAGVEPNEGSPGWNHGQSDHSKSLRDHNFVTLWPTETHSTSFERSKPSLLTQSLFKR